MLVGQTGSGKSVSWRILQGAMTRMKRDGEPGFNIVKVKTKLKTSFSWYLFALFACFLLSFFFYFFWLGHLQNYFQLAFLCSFVLIIHKLLSCLVVNDIIHFFI